MKKVWISILIISVCLISVAYSIHKRELSVSLKGTITGGYFKILDISSDSNTALFNELTIEDHIVLDSIDSTKTYTIVIGNKSGIDYTFLKDTKLVYSNKNITYSYTVLNQNTTVYDQSVLTFSITFGYNVDVITDNSLDFKIEFVFADKSAIQPSTQYVDADNMTLFLSSQDDLVGTFWPDHVNSNSYETVDVVKDIDSYYFNGNDSCVLTNKTLIPVEGDLTVEAYIHTSDDVVSDQAIVSQKSQTVSRDDYRSKLYIKDNSLKFFSAKDTGNTHDFVVKSDIQPNTDYLIQIVREGTELHFYINGVMSNVTTGFTESLSNETTQIGCFMQNDSKMKQNFNGNIFAVRIYKRALTLDELKDNAELDMVIHSSDVNLALQSFYRQLLDDQLVASGPGLHYASADDRYIFKGNDVNNYVRVDNKIWRIISVEKDRNVKLIDTEYITTTFDEESNRNPVDSTYCVDSDNLNSSNIKFGCNAWSAIDEISNGTVTGNVYNNSSLNDYLNNDYFEQLGNKMQQIMLKSDFYIGPANIYDSGIIKHIAQAKKYTWNGYVGLVTTIDIYDSDLIASGFNSSFQYSYLSDIAGNNYMWTMTPYSINTYDVTCLVNTKLGERRSTRTKQESHPFVAHPVVAIRSDIDVYGEGTIDNPYYFPALELNAMDSLH